MCLCDLGKSSGNGPVIGRDFGKIKLSVVYDFRRHAEDGMLHDSVDLIAETNDWMLFGGITSFEAAAGENPVWKLVGIMIDEAAVFCSDSELTPLARLEANQRGLRVSTKTLHNRIASFDKDSAQL